jgi:cell division protein FtsB
VTANFASFKNLSAASMRLLRRPVVWITVGTAAIVAWLMFSRYGVLTRLELEQTNRELDVAIEHQRQILDSLRQYRNRLVNDSFLLERLARERYGMVRPSETVLIVIDSSK